MRIIGDRWLSLAPKPTSPVFFSSFSCSHFATLGGVRSFRRFVISGSVLRWCSNGGVSGVRGPHPLLLLLLLPPQFFSKIGFSLDQIFIFSRRWSSESTPCSMVTESTPPCVAAALLGGPWRPAWWLLCGGLLWLPKRWIWHALILGAFGLCRSVIVLGLGLLFCPRFIAEEDRILEGFKVLPRLKALPSYFQWNNFRSA